MFDLHSFLAGGGTVLVLMGVIWCVRNLPPPGVPTSPQYRGLAGYQPAPTMHLDLPKDCPFCRAENALTEATWVKVTDGYRAVHCGCCSRLWMVTVNPIRASDWFPAPPDE